MKGFAQLCVAWVTISPSALLCGAQTTSIRPPFDNSGALGAQTAFRDGLAALHNFQYLEAAEAFQAAQRIDPRFALTYWGEALTHAHLLWNEYDAAAGRAALAKLGASPSIRRNAGRTALERDLLAAADALFERDSLRAALPAYARHMEAIYRRRVSDPDISALYALSLLAQAPPGPGGIRARAPAIDVLERTFARWPRHPGAAHYLIHAYDDVDHAALGLRAAEAYAPLAPSSSHAQHMPSHIFLQLGHWAASARSNQAAYDASVRIQQKNNWPVARRDWHALLWLSYALAQQGRFARLDTVLREFGQLASETNNASAIANHAAARALRTLESGEWATAPNLTQARAGIPLNEGNVLLASAFGAMHRRDTLAADSIRARFAEFRAASEAAGGTVPGVIQILALMADALAYAARETRDSVIAITGRAAVLEKRQPLTSGIQLPIKPASEMYGEVLLAFERPREALEQFNAVLQRIPNRPFSLWGLARTQLALRDTAAARATAHRLRDLWAEADTASLRMRRLRDFLAALDGKADAPAEHGGRTPPPESTYVLVVNRSSHAVSVLDGRDFRLHRSLRTDEGPHETATVGGQWVLTPAFGVYARVTSGVPRMRPDWVEGKGHTLTIASLHDTTQRRVVDLGPCVRPHGIVATARRAWITCEEIGEVWEFEPATGVRTRRFETKQRGSHTLVVDTARQLLWVANVGSSSVSAINLMREQTTIIATGAGAEGLALSPDGRELWVGNTRDGTITVVDTERRRESATFAAGGRFPVRLRFIPSRPEVWVLLNQSNAIAIFDKDRRTQIATIPLTSAPLGLGVSRDGDRVFVTLPREDTLLVFDTASRRIMRRIPVGLEPDGIVTIP